MTDPATIEERILESYRENDNDDRETEDLSEQEIEKKRLKSLSPEEIEVLFLGFQAMVRSQLRQSIDWIMRELSGEGFHHQILFAGRYVDLLARLYDKFELRELRETLLELKSRLRDPMDAELRPANPVAYDPSLYEYQCAKYTRWYRVLDAAVKKLTEPPGCKAHLYREDTPMQKFVSDLYTSLKILRGQIILFQMSLKEEHVRFLATSPARSRMEGQIQKIGVSQETAWPDPSPKLVAKTRKS